MFKYPTRTSGEAQKNPNPSKSFCINIGYFDIRVNKTSVYLYSWDYGRVGPIWVQPIPIEIYSPSRYFCQYRYICTNISATDTDADFKFYFG